jgi:hypothetical protein
MFRGRMFHGGKLAVTLAFTSVVALATGVSCRGFFVKPTLTSVAVGPATPTIQTGTTNNTVQMFAVATFDDGTTGTTPVSWSSGTEAVATITTGGLASAVATGTSVITASANLNPSLTGTQTLTVTVGCITDIKITPNTLVTFTAGGQTTQQFTATATTCNGPVDITQLANWSSSNTSLVTVTAGLATATQTAGLNGNVTISASSAGIVSSQNGTIQVVGF